MNIEQQLEGRQSRRLAVQDKFLGRTERREAIADDMIGELTSGKTYIFPIGGKYREGTRAELVAFLVQNRYV